jgi:hypothetical protein
MRIGRMVTGALFCLACSAPVLEAQGGDRYFENSWFWGLNGGATIFTAGVDRNVRVNAPTAGGEWLITRTRIALRVAIQQAFFEKQASVFDASQGGLRPVAVKDWRRYAAELYAFPKAFGSLRPYGGIGLALNVLQNADPVGSFESEAALDSTLALLQETSSRASFIVTAGAQAGIGRAALFLQASSMPTRNNFLFSRSSYTFVVEAGLRYNFGSAIEKF